MQIVNYAANGKEFTGRYCITQADAAERTEYIGVRLQRNVIPRNRNHRWYL